MPASVYSGDFRAALDSARNASDLKKTTAVSIDGKTHQVPTSFPSPTDWRDTWIYFLLVDRFNNPRNPPRATWNDQHFEHFMGGTIAGITEQLPYLQKLGVTALWLSPVLKNCPWDNYTYHGYGIHDFLSVDPRFGTKDDLKKLILHAHARGIYVILDIVLNHVGSVFAYTQGEASAAEVPWSDNPLPISWYTATGIAGGSTLPDPCNPDEGVWPKELQDNALFRRKGRGGPHELEGDFCSLKELDTSNLFVRDVLIKAYSYAIAEFDFDGFRIDTLKYIEVDFAQTFGNSMREFALSLGKRNFFTYGEVYDSEEKIRQFIGKWSNDPDAQIGVDSALDFPLFYLLPGVIKGFIAPAELIRLYEQRKQFQKNHISSHGEAGKYFVTFIDNHDMKERFYYDGEDGRFNAQVAMAVGALFCLQGIPCIYYGTEQGVAGSGPTDRAVRQALWGKDNPFATDNQFFSAVEQLSLVRSSQPALRYGRQYFRQLSGNGIDFGHSTTRPGIIAFSRILSNDELLIVINTNSRESWYGSALVDSALNHTEPAWKILYNSAGKPTPAELHALTVPNARIWALDDSYSEGTICCVPIALQPLEIQILAKG